MVRSQESMMGVPLRRPMEMVSVINIILYFLVLKNSFGICLYMCVDEGVPGLTCGGHRIALSWFLMGSNSGHQD